VVVEPESGKIDNGLHDRESAARSFSLALRANCAETRPSSAVRTL
jgi:hypothetical protein